MVSALKKPLPRSTQVMPPETAGFGYSMNNKVLCCYENDFLKLYFKILEKFEIDRKDLTFLEKIGSGQFGVCF